MNIQQKDNGKEGVFFIEENGEQVAEMTYTWDNATHFTILHTEVNKSMEGKGIGKQLVEKGVSFAREKHSTLTPQCKFARAIIDKTPEWEDVVGN